jgi:hypothetical protein
MKLLLGEERILDVDSGTLVLSSHRVRHERIQRGQSRMMSICLTEVVSCGLTTRSTPWLLVVGVLLALGGIGLITDNDSTGTSILLLGAGCLAAYFLTRKAILSIASAGDRIELATKGRNREDLVAFVDAVERTKLHLEGTPSVPGTT